MKDVNLSNFSEGQIWISKKKEKYRIVSIERDNPICWYPILLEHAETKILVTSDPDGNLYNDFQILDDKLVMKVSDNFDPTKSEKDLASRMLKIYNKRRQMMEDDRKKNNERVKKNFRLDKKK